MIYGQYSSCMWVVSEFRCRSAAQRQGRATRRSEVQQADIPGGHWNSVATCQLGFKPTYVPKTLISHTKPVGEIILLSRIWEF